MYEKVLNEKAVAGDIVDRLRDITNAPLSSCIEAARSILDSLSDYVHEEPFTRIASAIHSFEIDVDNCRDSKMFDMLITRLEVIFHEKEELSYSVSQDDEQLIEYLSLLTDTVSKTDPKIACNAVSRHDFSWLNSLINIFQMDQNDRVHEAVVQCIDVLTATCPQLAPYFVESKLLVVIAHKVPVSSKLLSTIDKLSLALLARLFSTSALPPLSHFDTSFVERILGHFVEHQDLILQCLIAINYSVPHVDENPVMTALSSSRIPLFGEIFTSNLNKNFSEQGLRLLLDILKCDRLIDDLFYSNDLAVLKQVLSRELVNDESEKIRSLCLDAIESCALNGIRCQDIRHAVEQSSVEEAKKLRVLKVLDSH